MAAAFDVHDWVYGLRTLPIQRFYPMAAVKATGLSLPEVWEELNKLVYAGWLSLLYEVRCPDCATSIRIVATNDPTSLYEEEASCTLCGHDCEISAECIFPLFQINDEWRAGGKKEPAVTGSAISTSGGAVSLAEMRLAQISLVDLLPPNEAAVLRKQLDDIVSESKTALELKPMVEDLSRIPRNKSERKAVIERLRQFAKDTDAIWRFGKSWVPWLYLGVKAVLSYFGVEIPVDVPPIS